MGTADSSNFCRRISNQFDVAWLPSKTSRTQAVRSPPFRASETGCLKSEGRIGMRIRTNHATASHVGAFFILRSSCSQATACPHIGLQAYLCRRPFGSISLPKRQSYPSIDITCKWKHNLAGGWKHIFAEIRTI